MDYVLKELGYSPADQNIRVYWCKPGHKIGDGLVAIKWEKDAELMKKCVVEEKQLMVYIDHVNLLEKQRWDAVSVQQAQLPPVLSPSKQPEKKRSEVDDAEGQYEAELSSDDDTNTMISCCSANSSDLDSDFVDSDYDFEEDDEQFKKNVDEGVKDDLIEKTQSKSNIQREPKQDIAEEEELELPEEHKSGITYKWKMFNKLTDMQNLSYSLCHC
jgi:hypothetical protein